MFNTKPQPDAVAWMSGDFSHEALLREAVVTERLGTLNEAHITFEVEKRVTYKDFLGKAMCLHVELEPNKGRSFSGICVSVDTRIDGNHTYLEAEVRPWFWMLTRKQDSRIFQDKSVKEIIEQVFSDAGFSDYELKLNATYEKRTYCVQYRESDFDFLSRLMEQEGIYYYVPCDLNEQHTDKIIICDDLGGHSAVPEYSNIEYCLSDSIGTSSDDQIYDWTLETSVLTGKVTLDDFNFERPKSDLTKVSAKKSGSHSYTSYELYDHPGKQTFQDVAVGAEGNRGEHLARVRMEAEACRFEVWTGRTGVRTMGVGRTFSLKNHPSSDMNQEYLVVSAQHKIAADAGGGFRKLDKDRSVYSCNFSVIPTSVPYRSQPRTQWPGIPGLNTATVVGPSGEEIYTDQYGRIKVQFHWDREGKNDENSSCWVRVVTPWSGKDWGMIHIPRIGQEVVIQFEEGDPDRPICTGMLYNKETMPPWGLPDNKTQSGIKTLSSKGGTASTTYNEIMFEDKKDAELIRMQAQKDHEFLIKDMQWITVGHPEVKKAPNFDDFSMSTVVKQNITEQITDGDKFRKIDKGSETIEIKKDKTQIVEGKHTKTITGNDTLTVKEGNLSETIKMGDMSTEVSMGNQSTQVKMGNISVKADLGSITMEAMQKIELKVGPSSIKIDMSGVTVKGPMIKVEGTAMTEVKAPMTQVKGDAMLVLKGGITMIN